MPRSCPIEERNDPKGVVQVKAAVERENSHECSNVRRRIIRASVEEREDDEVRVGIAVKGVHELRLLHQLHLKHSSRASSVAYRLLDAR